MSRSADIFVDTDQSLEDFKNTLESIIGKKLQRRQRGDETWYEFSDDHVLLTAGEHEFINDRDMPFEEYRYHIGLRAVGARDENEDTAWKESLAQQIFANLKAAKRYRLLLVDDVQVKRDEYQPVARAAL